MKILVIDATYENLVVCACDGDKIAEKISNEGSKRHNSIILPYVDEVLNELKITLNDIDAFACVVGPGSFTGIRIGVSTVKAFSFACNKPCIAINELEEVAYNHKDSEFYTAIDARHDNYYGAKFNGAWNNMAELENYTTEDFSKVSCPVYYKDGAAQSISLINIAKAKFEKQNFEELMPLYLKKSQAEREKEEQELKLKNNENI